MKISSEKYQNKINNIHNGRPSAFEFITSDNQKFPDGKIIAQEQIGRGGKVKRATILITPNQFLEYADKGIAITAVADFIYRHTGIKNDSMIINGEQYSEYLNGIDLNNTTYSSEEKTSTENEIERVTIKEIRLEGEQLQQTKAELLAEMRIAARYGNYDKASRINNELIPLLEERIRQNDLRMLDAMIREQDGFSLKY